MVVKNLKPEKRREAKNVQKVFLKRDWDKWQCLVARCKKGFQKEVQKRYKNISKENQKEQFLRITKKS